MLNGWYWAYAQDQPISLLESESEIDKSFITSDPQVKVSYLGLKIDQTHLKNHQLKFGPYSTGANKWDDYYNLNKYIAF